MFSKDKETTGTIRYAEIVPDDVARVKNVYLQKPFAKELGHPAVMAVSTRLGSHFGLAWPYFGEPDWLLLAGGGAQQPCRQAGDRDGQCGCQGDDREVDQR